MLGKLHGAAYLSRGLCELLCMVIWVRVARCDGDGTACGRAVGAAAGTLGNAANCATVAADARCALRAFEVIYVGTVE